MDILNKIKKVIKKNRYIYKILKIIYLLLFRNAVLGKILWIKARYLHNSKVISYTPCLCGNNQYNIYLKYKKNKVISCLNCYLKRNYPQPDTGIYENYLADIYRKNSELSMQIKESCKRIKERKSLNSNVLDFGCGDGRAMSFLKSIGFKNIYGLEISDQLFKIAKEKSFTIFNNTNEIPKDLKFDVVFSNHVFEHIFDLKETLDKIKKVLKDDAIIVICVPNVRSNLVKSGFHDFLWKTHFWQFDPETMNNFLKNNGFGILDCQTMHDDGKTLETTTPSKDGKEGLGLYIMAKKITN